MVLVRIIFMSWKSEEFVAFTMSEAESLVNEYDSKDLVSVHIYPNHNKSD